jgi:hypothetical protein
VGGCLLGVEKPSKSEKRHQNISEVSERPGRESSEGIKSVNKVRCLRENGRLVRGC